MFTIPENVHKCRLITYLVTLNSVHNSRKRSQMSIDHIPTLNSVHNSRKRSQMSIDHILSNSKQCSQFQKTFTNVDWSHTLNSVHNSRKRSQMSIDHILTLNSVHNSRKRSQMSIDHILTPNSVHNSRKRSQMSNYNTSWCLATCIPSYSRYKGKFYQVCWQKCFNTIAVVMYRNNCKG